MMFSQKPGWPRVAQVYGGRDLVDIPAACAPWTRIETISMSVSGGAAVRESCLVGGR